MSVGQSPELIVCAYLTERTRSVAVSSVRSMLKQDRRPDRIVLGCPREVKPPGGLRSKRVFLHFTDAADSVDWLLETMRRHPGDAVVAAHPGFRYPREWLGSLYGAWHAQPQHIHCCAARYLLVTQEDRALPVRHWPLGQGIGSVLLPMRDLRGPNGNLQPIYEAGVIYPPGAFCNVEFPPPLLESTLGDGIRLGMMGLFAGFRVKRMHPSNSWPSSPLFSTIAQWASADYECDLNLLQKAYEACRSSRRATEIVKLKEPLQLPRYQNELAQRRIFAKSGWQKWRSRLAPSAGMALFKSSLRVLARGFRYPRLPVESFKGEIPTIENEQRLVWCFAYSMFSRFPPRLFPTSPRQVPHIARAEPPLIVSLASIPSRLDSVSICVHSLLRQSLKPDKLILWLPDNIDTIPSALSRLRKYGLDIRMTPEIGPHKKLIPCLRDYPEARIATADDDRIYPPQWLEGLIRAYQTEPEFLHCYMGKFIVKDADGLAPYDQWLTPRSDPEDPTLFIEPNLNMLAMSGGGALFAPGLLNAEALNEEVFLEICPYADDIWYKAMSLMNNVKVKKLHYPNVSPLVIPNSQNDALYIYNMGQSGNDIQARKVFERYGLFERLASSEAGRTAAAADGRG